MDRKTLLKIKLGVMMALALYVAAFIVVNSLYTTQVWLLPWLHPELPVAVVIGVTIVVTVLLTWFGRQLIRTIRELRGSGEPAETSDDTPNQQDQG